MAQIPKFHWKLILAHDGLPGYNISRINLSLSDGVISRKGDYP